MARLRVRARELGLRRVDAGPAAIALTPGAGFAWDVWKSEGLELSGERLLVRVATHVARGGAAVLEELFDNLASDRASGRCAKALRPALCCC